MASEGLDRMRSFYSAIFAAYSALMEPQQGFFKLGDCTGIFSALKFAVLESFKAANHHDNKVFIHNAVHSAFLDGAFLEMDAVDYVSIVSLDNLEKVRSVVFIVFFFHDRRVFGREKVVFCLGHLSIHVFILLVEG